MPLHNVAILLYELLVRMLEWETARAPIKRHQTHHLDVSLDDHNEVVGGRQRGLESL